MKKRSEHRFRVGPGLVPINGTYVRVTSFRELVYKTEYEVEERVEGLGGMKYSLVSAKVVGSVELANLSEREKYDLMQLAGRDVNGVTSIEEKGRLEDRVEKKAA